MGVYIYCLKKDHLYQSAIKGHTFENEWFKLGEDGSVLIKGTNKNGYAWDGCSPKFKLKDIYFGTPEAVLNPKTGESKTFYASLVHDVFYQFSAELKSFVKRQQVDQEFYAILKRDEFRFAGIYYYAVRLLGWLFWG
ncbi:MAG: hypothetical protein PHV60_02255 [bacterium]|nr:hypothetical protein [bacterium]